MSGLDSRKKMITGISSLTGEVEWYTPRQYLDAAVSVMGELDLDPASSEAAQKNVRAKKFFTTKEDGLSQPWHARNVFLNPPYASRFIGKFVSKMVRSYEAGEFREGILLTNNAADTEWFRLASEGASAVCFTTGRIRFLEARGGAPIRKNSPIQGQAFFYFGRKHQKFMNVFSAFGFFPNSGVVSR